MIQHLISDFIFFFAVIDPVGSVPVFIAITKGMKKETKKKVAKRAVLIAGGVLLFFIVVGELILTAIDIPLEAFEIAGGIVLFLFALSMIFGESKPEREKELISDANEKAVYPLAMPSIASPGAMLAAVLLTKNEINSIPEQALSTLMMILVLSIVWILLLMSTRIYRFIGDGGASIISRVMGLILSSVAVASILHGISDYFHF